jgi:excisionase family DNA binding protein
MYLSVQQAARRLGVSPVTVRRWTATGFLPCTRTAGGHRRIDEHDIDDLARAIGNSNHLAAQLARERELDVLVDTSIALASRLDVTDLLAEIARRMTALLDCHFCAISEFDERADIVYVLADYDHSGQRLPDTGPYKLGEYPLTRRVLEERITAIVNVDDPHVDQAEAAVLRRDGDKSLLMAPLVYLDRVIGLVEVVDQKRARHYTRQELRLCRAIAGQAAAALHNAKLFADQARSDHDISRLRTALHKLAVSVPAVVASPADALLAEVARAAVESLEAVSCVASAGGVSAGAFGDAAAAFENGDERGTKAMLVVARDPSGQSDLALAVTLAEPPSEGQTELLDLIAAAGGALLTR